MLTYRLAIDSVVSYGDIWFLLLKVVSYVSTYDLHGGTWHHMSAYGFIISNIVSYIDKGPHENCIDKPQ